MRLKRIWACHDINYAMQSYACIAMFGVAVELWAAFTEIVGKHGMGMWLNVCHFSLSTKCQSGSQLGICAKPLNGIVS
jgi:hypothetical protein